MRDKEKIEREQYRGCIHSRPSCPINNLLDGVLERNGFAWELHGGRGYSIIV